MRVPTTLPPKPTHRDRQCELARRLDVAWTLTEDMKRSDSDQMTEYLVQIEIHLNQAQQRVRELKADASKAARKEVG